MKKQNLIFVPCKNCSGEWKRINTFYMKFMCGIVILLVFILGISLLI